MHVLFLHQNVSAQFGPLISRLVHVPGWRISYLHMSGDDRPPGAQCLQYEAESPGKTTHPVARPLDNIARQSEAALALIRNRPDVRPDLIVAHSGFVSFLPLQEHFGCPVVSYQEYYFHSRNSDIDFRPEQRPDAEARARARFRNATVLLDLECADAGLCPTHWQRSLFPSRYRDKLEVIFDGVDTELWKRQPADRSRRIGRVVVPEGFELVTYAARGFESMRGFDIFMRFAQRLAERRPRARFLVAGSEKISYGADRNRTGGKSFKRHVLERGDYDLGKFVFLKTMPPEHLAALFGVSDLHVYLTAPFVPSWSLFNAMACEAPLLVSDTAPLHEVIQDGANGARTPFFDIEAMADRADELLNDAELRRRLGTNARQTILELYSCDVTVPLHRRFFEDVVNRRTG